ncbi:hypothetical protein ACXYTP_21700 [Tsukamurella ocularis]
MTETTYRTVHVVTIEGGYALDDLLVGLWNGSTLRHYAEGVRGRGGQPLAVGGRADYGRRVHAPMPELDRLYGLPADPDEAAREREARRIVCFHRRIRVGTITYDDTTSHDPAVIRAAALATLGKHDRHFFANADELTLWDRLGLTPDGQRRDHPLLPADAAVELRRQVDALDLPLAMAKPAVEGLWTELFAEVAGIRDGQGVAA